MIPIFANKCPKIMKALFVFTLLLLSALTSFARNITGLVYSDSTMTVVADAVCKLHEGDTERR